MNEIKQSFTQNPVGKEETKKPIFAVIYARVSTGRQLRGYSMEQQIELALERCKVMNWRVRYIFKENGVSAATTDRPKFQQMMKKARQRAFDIIVFWKIDRLCRSLTDLVNVERELRTYDISLHSITEQIDTASPIGKFNFRNIASASELERDMIKERTQMGMTALALKHKWPNRTPPLGCNRGEDGTLVINKEEVKLVKEIFHMYLQLKSMPQVAYELNKRGLKTHRQKRWTNMSVKKILDNEIYIGKYNVSGVEAYIKELKIISENQFNKAKELRNRYMEKPKTITEERRLGTIEHVFNEYLAFLDEMDTEENMRII